jgi:hypothetical protein
MNLTKKRIGRKRSKKGGYGWRTPKKNRRNRGKGTRKTNK